MALNLITSQCMEQRFNGHLNVTGAKISDDFHIESSSIEKNIFLSVEKVVGKLKIILSNINGSIYMSISEISYIDLGGSNIKGDSHVGTAGQKVKWQQVLSLI